MGQVMTLCTSDEADEHGYDKTTVEKVKLGALIFSLSPDVLVNPAQEERANTTFADDRHRRAAIIHTTAMVINRKNCWM